MSNWYDRAAEEIQKDHDDGLITDREYQTSMRELDQEYRAYAQEEADQYFDSLMMVSGY